jgi:general secretion pathway protein B
MSFILDALRKSEHDRQRQVGPALAEVAVAQPKPRTNVWATVAIALLVVNLVAIGVVLLRKASRPAVATAPTAEAQARPTPVVTDPPAAPPAATAPPAPAQVSLTRTAPPMLQPARTPESAKDSSRNPLADEVAEAPDAGPELMVQAATPPSGPPAVTKAPTKRGSVVYESLPDDVAVGGPPSAAAAQAQRPASTAVQNLPSADELAAAGGVPALSLDLHVYATNAAERMAFINGRKYREGDTLAEGALVRQITPDGVILEMNGRRFLLGRD